MAFYQFLSIFPVLLLVHIAAEHGLTVSPEARQSFIDTVSKLLPTEIVQMFGTVTGDLSHVTLPGWRWLTSSAGGLWAGCNGTWAMIYGLNVAYEVRESRRPLPLALTIVGLTVALGAITGLTLGLLSLLAGLDRYASFPSLTALLQLAVVIAVVLFWFTLLYRFAPSITSKRWQWSTPGALLAATLWLFVTLGARIYFERFANYRATFGRLSGVAMLMLWLYATNGAILIGGEMNSEIEKAAKKLGPILT